MQISGDDVCRSASAAVIAGITPISLYRSLLTHITALHHPPPLSITLTDAHIALAHLWFVLHKTHLIMCLVTLLPKYVQCTLLFSKVFIENF